MKWLVSRHIFFSEAWGGIFIILKISLFSKLSLFVVLRGITTGMYGIPYA